MRDKWIPYSRLLEDPRWAWRRLEILMRDDYACQECGYSPMDDESLEVHHRHYRAGANPWEYEDCDLVTLCGPCHRETTDWLERVHRAVGRLPIAAMPQIVRYVEQMQTVRFPVRLPLAVDEDAA